MSDIISLLKESLLKCKNYSISVQVAVWYWHWYERMKILINSAIKFVNLNFASRWSLIKGISRDDAKMLKRPRY